MTDQIYLAVFLGSKNSPQMKAWEALPEDERNKRAQEGMAAWHGWMQKHAACVLEIGGPLGKTKKISAQGIADIANDMGGFSLVRAASHEAAAKMFENHPHFAIFPGERVEVMPVMPIPTM